MAPELSMRFTLPVELNSRELEARDSRERELLVYGSIPVMVTCPVHPENSGRMQ